MGGNQVNESKERRWKRAGQAFASYYLVSVFWLLPVYLVVSNDWAKGTSAWFTFGLGAIVAPALAALDDE